jgi:hypothetical protein
MTTPEIENCPICQDELKDESTIQTLPCNHKFHKDCIQKWIEMRNLCPLCKKVADTSQPVRELDDDRTDLTQQMIDNLILGSINQSGVNFWVRMLQGFPMSGLGGVMIRNRISDHIDDEKAEIFIEDIFSGPMIQSFDLFDEFSRIPFEFTEGPHGSHPSQPNRLSATQRLSSFTRTNNTGGSESSGDASRGIRNNRNHGDNIRYFPYPIQTPVRHPPIQQTPVRHSSIQQTYSHSDCPHQAQCANCYIIGCTHVIKRCGRCRQIRYCSRECQESNWPQHRDWCNAHRQQQQQQQQHREEKKE